MSSGMMLSEDQVLDAAVANLIANARFARFPFAHSLFTANRFLPFQGQRSQRDSFDGDG